MSEHADIDNRIIEKYYERLLIGLLSLRIETDMLYYITLLKYTYRVLDTDIL